MLNKCQLFLLKLFGMSNNRLCERRYQAQIFPPNNSNRVKIVSSSKTEGDKVRWWRKRDENVPFFSSTLHCQFFSRFFDKCYSISFWSSLQTIQGNSMSKVIIFSKLLRIPQHEFHNQSLWNLVASLLKVFKDEAKLSFVFQLNWMLVHGHWSRIILPN